MAHRNAEYGRRKRFTCPHCGAVVEPGALACPECGSDERTGWSPHAADEEVDIPAGYSKDKEFDYEDFVKREFPEERRTVFGISLPLFLLLALAVILVVALALALLGNR